MMINWLIIPELHGLTAARQLVNDCVFFLWNADLQEKGIYNNTPDCQKSAFFLLGFTRLLLF